MKTLGQIAYEAFCGEIEWRSDIAGKQLPAWNDTTIQLQFAWHAAVKAVYDSILINCGIYVD